MVYETLLKRRSIREFTDRKVEREKVERLLKSALLSPSSRNIRPWEFVLVDDRDTLRKLALCKPHGAAFLGNAALAIAVIADVDKSDVWVEDASIASMSLLLVAEELGLGACWSQIRKREHDDQTTAGKYVKALLNIPDNYDVESIIGVGYAEKKRPPYDDNALPFDKLHHNSFGVKALDGD